MRHFFEKTYYHFRTKAANKFVCMPAGQMLITLVDYRIYRVRNKLLPFRFLPSRSHSTFLRKFRFENFTAFLRARSYFAHENLCRNVKRLLLGKTRNNSNLCRTLYIYPSRTALRRHVYASMRGQARPPDQVFAVT